ncbi:hypothetical protein RvY_16513-1 [Ramazzottius varieornatus]|uniref:Peptidase M1 membrane alanine aminopeptidase domain-containing protein n=1 Tax=Ramazzottius varieornatus TaxID=947166 RepID=A0A1D1W020_RAMVA|nr:hypothetical protein RvY_16513-1 [Ramazzottius varieornatus]
MVWQPGDHDMVGSTLAERRLCYLHAATGCRRGDACARCLLTVLNFHYAVRANVRHPEQHTPILTNVTDPSEIAALFDEITYSKGASVLLMLYESLGPPVFQKGVTNYLNEHKFGNAVSEALWSSLDDAWLSNTPRITTKKIADKWTLQAKPLYSQTGDLPQYLRRESVRLQCSPSGRAVRRRVG